MTNRSINSVLPAVAASLALLAFSAAPASAARGDAVVKDCTNDGRIDKTYSPADYSEALNGLPTDVDEYTDCREVIRRAQLASRRRGSEKGDADRRVQTFGQGFIGSADAPADKEERRRLRAEADAGRIVELDNTSVEPGKPGNLSGQTASSTNDLPGSLLAGLIALGAAVVLTAGGRLLARRRSS